MNSPNIIKTPHNIYIISICILEDKRLVSSDWEGKIVVYNKSNKPQIEIQNAHDGSIWSLCGLRNGDLASASEDTTIKIWRIAEKDYQLLRTLTGHICRVTKVIQLENERICSCSDDKTIRVWDSSTYQLILITEIQLKDKNEVKKRNYYDFTDLEDPEDLDYFYSYSNTRENYASNYHPASKEGEDLCSIMTMIEVSDYIVSCSYDKTLRIWNKSTYECIKVIRDVCCCSINALEKLNDHTVLIGGEDVIFIVDIESSEVRKFKDYSLGYIRCFKTIRSDLVLVGNERGEVCSYDPTHNKIVSRLQFHERSVNCLIGSVDSELISCSADKTIRIF